MATVSICILNVHLLAQVDAAVLCQSTALRSYSYGVIINHALSCRPSLSVLEGFNRQVTRPNDQERVAGWTWSARGQDMIGMDGVCR